MNYGGVEDDLRVSSGGDVFFVGPSATFSKVVLRTAENELDCQALRVPDLNALRFAREDRSGRISPAYMVVVHEGLARDLLNALATGADYLPRQRLAIAYESDDGVCAQFADTCEALLEYQVSLLPMNINVTSWVRLLQVIQAGGHYVPPQMLHVLARGGHEAEAARAARGADATAPRAAAAPRQGGREPLTPREYEVLAMAADGRANKIIAHELDLSEHTVKLYMHRIIGKLGVSNRTEAAVWYHQRGSHASHG